MSQSKISFYFQRGKTASSESGTPAAKCRKLAARSEQGDTDSELVSDVSDFEESDERESGASQH